MFTYFVALQVALDKHNQYRRLHQNTPDLILDSQVSETAQRIADRQVWGHSQEGILSLCLSLPGFDMTIGFVLSLSCLVTDNDNGYYRHFLKGLFFFCLVLSCHPLVLIVIFADKNSLVIFCIGTPDLRLQKALII